MMKMADLNSKMQHFFHLQLSKGQYQYHEIFDPWFFHQSIIPRSLIIILKYFRIWIRFRRDIREYVPVAQSRRENLELNFMMSCIVRSRRRNFL
jgi:hypothetical protein